MGTAAQGDGEEAPVRLRKLEEIVIRLDERSRVYESLVPRVVELEKAVNSLWVAVGQLKIKSALVWSGVAVIGGAVASVLTNLITR